MRKIKMYIMRLSAVFLLFLLGVLTHKVTKPKFIIGAVPVVAAGLKIASAIKDQFLPELSKPLSGCGSLCNNAQLEQQMRVFKHIMRPENMNANVSDFTVPTENVVERQESALLLLEEPQPTRGRHGEFYFNIDYFYAC